MAASTSIGSSERALPRPLDAAPAGAWVPGRADAWWTAVLPVAILVPVLAIHFLAPEFYRAYVLPEGYGFLELTQFLLAGAAAVLCFHALGYKVVRGSTLLWLAVLFFGLAAFYIAGEEHSWGQHFFNWNTPAYWSEINRQQETNLHNTSPWFNQRPKLLFDNAMFVGGLLIPLIQLWTGGFRQPLLALLTPPLAIAAPAVIALAFKVVDDLGRARRADLHPPQRGGGDVPVPLHAHVRHRASAAARSARRGRRQAGHALKPQRGRLD